MGRAIFGPSADGCTPRRRSRWAVAVLVAVVGTFGTVVPARAQAPAYLTISFGRTQWVLTDGKCVPLPGTVDLGQVASDMSALGVVGNGTVIPDRTSETGFTCIGNYYLSPGWDTLASLRDTYGWSFISHSQSYLDMTTLSSSDQYAQSCGSLTAFDDHGFADAWGLFAYPGNYYTTQIQTDVVSKCFAFGRRYSGAVNAEATTTAPWFANTDSVNGGSCNDSSLPCYTVKGATRRYRSPANLAGNVSVQPGNWYNVQFYRFVSGSRGTPSGKGTWRWDCTSSDWHQHWTSRAELYCYNDFLQVIHAVPSTVTVTGPATVATAWGRTPPFS